jgi:hypothetical protein
VMVRVTNAENLRSGRNYYKVPQDKESHASSIHGTSLCYIIVPFDKRCRGLDVHRGENLHKWDGRRYNIPKGATTYVACTDFDREVGEPFWLSLDMAFQYLVLGWPSVMIGTSILSGKSK